VMRPAEAEGLELIVGIADEIAVGEEQQLDDVPAQIGVARRGAARLSGTCGGTREIYVSHIDVSWVQCYKTISRDEHQAHAKVDSTKGCTGEICGPYEGPAGGNTASGRGLDL